MQTNFVDTDMSGLQNIARRAIVDNSLPVLMLGFDHDMFKELVFRQREVFCLASEDFKHPLFKPLNLLQFFHTSLNVGALIVNVDRLDFLDAWLVKKAIAVHAPDFGQVLFIGADKNRFKRMFENHLGRITAVSYTAQDEYLVSSLVKEKNTQNRLDDP